MVSEITDHVIQKYNPWFIIVPQSVVDLNFTLTNKSLNLTTLRITWKVSLNHNYTY